MWVQLFVWVVIAVLAVALAPKPPDATPAALGDIDVPTADGGRPIPVCFGTNLVTGPNVVWYGDLGYKKVKTKSGK